MSHRHTKPDQFELFGPSERTCPLQTPLWQNLPHPTRHKITCLMTRLLMEHSTSRDTEPAEEARNLHHSGESDDV